MNIKQNLLETCSKYSKLHAKLMIQYKEFFNCFLTHPLQAFGYERWTTDNIYFGLSNMSAIAELFVETDAFADQNVITQPKYMSSFCTFIYPDAKIYNPKYNNFRNGLEKHLQIRISFCIIKRQLNYCEAFVWNFKKPHMSLLEEKHVIINDFLRNSTLINACLNQFKKDIGLLCPKETLTGIDISQHSPLYKDNRNPIENMGDYSQYIELFHYIKLLQRENLTFEDFGLSIQEQKTIELFLQKSRPELKSYPSETLKKIALKFDSLKCSESFESGYNELQRIGLIK